MAKQVRTVYGTALFEAARDAGRLTSVREETEELRTVLTENPDFLRILCHPEITLEEKKKILEETLGPSMDPLIFRTVMLLLEKEHIRELPKVLEEMIRLSLEEEKIGEAEVTSAVELTEEQKERIRKKLLETTPYLTMRISYLVDRSLIGGLVIRLGDRVVDSSLRSKLARMKNSLMAGE